MTEQRPKEGALEEPTKTSPVESEKVQTPNEQSTTTTDDHSSKPEDSNSDPVKTTESNSPVKQLSPTQMKQIQEEIKQIKEQLNDLNAVKEKHYQEKEDFASKIRGSIDVIKSSKDLRNKRTSEVKEIKVERDKLNTQIKNKVQELKALTEKRQNLFTKLGIKKDPSRLKVQIEQLETKLETEVFSIEKEKNLNKQVRELKSMLNQSKEVTDVSQEIRTLQKDLRVLRKEAESKHRSLQDKAVLSQKRHEDLISSSSDVDDLRKKEEAAYKKFFEYKEKFNELNAQLKEKIKLINANNHSQDSSRRKKKEKKDAEMKKNLAEKEKSVEEKIKTGKKLTTEDLLIFQKT